MAPTATSSSFPACLDLDELEAGRDSDALDRACRGPGVFHLVGHGLDPELLARLERSSRAYFALPLAEKLALRMERGGRAWRGYFPVGGELTSGRPDRKEGLYFGEEHGPDHPEVRAGTPLFGPNLFPALPGFRADVLELMERLTEVGQRLLRCLARALGLPPDTFERGLTREPTRLFRIFHYPPTADDEAQGVGEHTDYGLLTLLWQTAPGLEVRTDAGWAEVPARPDALVCNLGDMCERLTGGAYRSVPHRVRSPRDVGRLAFPFFLDPGFRAELAPLLPPGVDADEPRERWDGESVHAFTGTYGDYLVRKVSRVFPELGRQVLD